MPTFLNGDITTPGHLVDPDPRESFADIPEVWDYPDFLDVQLKTFHDFVQDDVPPADREELSAGHRGFFDALAGTVFTSISRQELLAVSREIEDRARRVGDGILHVSFQRLSMFQSQQEVYEQLVAETALDVHVHGVDDWTPPEDSGIHYHAHDDERLAPYWVLAFDGGSDATQASGLVGKERPGEGFTGFWTNDEAMVERIRTAMASAVA